MKITIREKQLKNGMSSLYLDKRLNGKRQKEFLGIYIYTSPRNPVEREQNKQNNALVNDIRIKREYEMQSQNFGFKAKNSKITFLDYFYKLTEARKGIKTDYDNWKSTYLHAKIIFPKHLLLENVDKKWVEEFRDHLVNHKNRYEKNLANNSCIAYFNKFRACLKAAHNEELISRNPTLGVKGIKQQGTQREYLLEEEIKVLMVSDCEIPILKNAFLFSTATGLRWRDVKDLKWSQIQYIKGTGHVITYTQHKTKKVESTKIPDGAVGFIGERGKPEENVFKDLIYGSWLNGKLRDWIKNSGINKHITFHCARHTYATMLIYTGSTIFTVSNLLGHSEIRTTQIYAKLLDPTKLNAINALNSIFTHEKRPEL